MALSPSVAPPSKRKMEKATKQVEEQIAQAVAANQGAGASSLAEVAGLAPTQPGTPPGAARLDDTNRRNGQMQPPLGNMGFGFGDEEAADGIPIELEAFIRAHGLEVPATGCGERPSRSVRRPFHHWRSLLLVAWVVLSCYVVGE